MNKKSVLLVQPNYQRVNSKKNNIDNSTGAHPPLGLLYLAAILRENGFTPKIVDANLNRFTPDKIVEMADNFDIAGVSVFNQGYDFAVKLAKLLRKGVLKVCGGPFASGYVDEMLEQGFDIVVRGEGEFSFRSICRGHELEDIPGISWKKGTEIIHNKNDDFIDVNKIPFPARDLLPHGGTRWPYASAGTRVFPWAPIITSRGCPYACYYCSKAIHGFKFRMRDPESVIEEIIDLVERFGVREVHFVDDTFNFDVNRAIRICELIIESGKKISLRFAGGLRVDKITPELAKKLKQAGTSDVAFGIESGSQRVLDSIPKKITLDQIRQGVKNIQKEGMYTRGLFMLGLLADTEETMQQTIDFAKELNTDVASFSIATPYPGSKFYQMVKENGKLLINNWSDFGQTYGKLYYEYPGAPPPELVKKMFRKAYKDFYFRPGYNLRQIIKKRNFTDWKIAIRVGKDLLRNVFLRGK